MTLTGAQDLCQYERQKADCQPTRGSSGESTVEASDDTEMRRVCARPGPGSHSGLADEVQDLGYSNHGNHNSMSLLRATDLLEARDTDLTGSLVSDQSYLRTDADRKYKSLVRQLPSQACIQILTQTFFSSINWQYDLIDEQPFWKQLEAWGTISYSSLRTGISDLAPEMLVFPALLAQVLAQALLFHPPHDERIGSLMTMAEMTFHDLAAEYSDAGAEILETLGKNSLKIATVQARLLRASFLKSSGKVIEAWHTLGATIRDGQELGLHTGKAVSTPSPDGINTSFIGHRLWVVLHIWDVHMAVVLGRPTATDLQIDRFASTIQDHAIRKDLFYHWKTESDNPRPFDIILAGYHVAYRYFKDIHSMEGDRANTQDYFLVERIHADIQKNLEHLPSWCRLDNPNPMFDQLQGCQWLPAAREGLSSLIHLVVLTLHRPYIFSVADSRTEALNAGLSILSTQQRLFEQSEPHHCKVFNPVYASFDAIVLIAALCLVFPSENIERRTECIEAVERGSKRLGIIAESCATAKSAHSVACGLYRRLRHINSVSDTPEARDPQNYSDMMSFSNHTVSSNGISPGFLFGDVSPPRPTHDLFFDHLSGPQLPFIDQTHGIPFDPLTLETTEWNFEGDFLADSFWSRMNELDH
ncbi:unnamed protein product [Penicillium olsonii]|nr:unnamed protein product [Penicillium olsonii]CAG7934489.1 unnamed protein product [Penicillium olsonii]